MPVRRLGFEQREGREAVESVLIGEGRSPCGHPWKVLSWKSPSGEGNVDFVDEQGGAVVLRGGDRGLSEGQLVSIGGVSRGPDEQKAFGLVAAWVPRVSLRFADGTSIDAQLLRNEADDRSYWIAWASPDVEIDTALAVSDDGEILDQDAEYPEFCARLRRGRDRPSTHPPT